MLRCLFSYESRAVFVAPQTHLLVQTRKAIDDRTQAFDNRAQFIINCCLRMGRAHILQSLKSDVYSDPSNALPLGHRSGVRCMRSW